MQNHLFKTILTAFMVFLILGLSSISYSAVVYIPHITSGFDDWEDFLQIDNNGTVNTEYTLTLYGGGDVVYSQTHSVSSLSEDTVSLKPLASTATCGQISFSSDYLFFRLCYENSNGGLAEFKLTDTLNGALVFYFSDFTNAVEIKGMALANFGDTTAEITMVAEGNGSELGTAYATVNTHSRIFGVHSDWFPNLSAEEISRIIVTSTAPTLCGIVKNGRSDVSNLLFTAADALNDEPVIVDPVPGDYIAVDDNNLTGITDGSDLHPYTTIQSAVDAAENDSILRIAKGLYSETVSITNKHIGVMGGYEGGSNLDYSSGRGGNFSQFDPEQNIVQVEGNSTRAVVLIRGEGADGTEIHGLTITGGLHGIKVDGWPAPSDITIKDNIIQNNGLETIPEFGGGLTITGRNIKILTNKIHTNQALLGGGIYASEAENLLVQGNSVYANTGTGDHGGGLYLAGTGTVSSNLFENNDVGTLLEYGWGGGIVLMTGNWQLVNNRVRNNHAYSIGGGIFIDEGATASLQNNLVVNNRVTETGGAGIYVDGAGGGGPADARSYAEITNCTVADNTGGSLGGNGVFVEFSDVTVKNSIFWGNGGDDFFKNPQSTLNVGYSLSQETVAGTGNLNSDPLFNNAAADDYHLKSTSGRWNPVSGQWEVDSGNSPAIDTGDPESEYASEPMPNGGNVNMGFFGNSSEASKSN